MMFRLDSFIPSSRHLRELTPPPAHERPDRHPWSQRHRLKAGDGRGSAGLAASRGCRNPRTAVVGPVAAQDRPAGDFPGSEIRPLDRSNGVTFRQRRICREIRQFSGVNRGLAAGTLNLLGFFSHGAEPLQIALATLMGESSHESFNNTLAKKMKKLFDLMFSLKGRISRKTFWIYYATAIAAAAVPSALDNSTFTIMHPEFKSAELAIFGVAAVFLLLWGIGNIAVLVHWLAGFS